MPYLYEIYDVFTDTPLAGNPLAVVFAQGLATERCQAIAREFNLSETVFIGEPSDPANTASARIFTPADEMAFAGHPTVGAATALRRRGVSAIGSVAIELAAGLVRCAFEGDRVAFDAPKLPTREGDLEATEAMAEALGLPLGALGSLDSGALGPVRAIGGGPRFTMVPVREVRDLERVRIDQAGLAKAFGSGWDAVYLFAQTGPGRYRARLFAPSFGIQEDPATGSAAAALAAVLAGDGGLGDGEHRFEILQGEEMGRPSRIGLTVRIDGGTLTSVGLAGTAVKVAEGSLIL